MVPMNIESVVSFAHNTFQTGEGTGGDRGVSKGGPVSLVGPGPPMVSRRVGVGGVRGFTMRIRHYRQRNILYFIFPRSNIKSCKYRKSKINACWISATFHAFLHVASWKNAWHCCNLQPINFCYSQCCQGFETTMREIYPLPSIGVGDGWKVPPPKKNNGKNIFQAIFM